MNYCTTEEIELQREIRKNKLFKSDKKQDFWLFLFFLAICSVGLLMY